jgi:hypothetical protein
METFLLCAILVVLLGGASAFWEWVVGMIGGGLLLVLVLALAISAPDIRDWWLNDVSITVKVVMLVVVAFIAAYRAAEYHQRRTAEDKT